MELTKIDDNSVQNKKEFENEIVELTSDMLMHARLAINSKESLKVPIAELSSLGAGISSLVPAFNTVSQTTSIATEGLYRVANAAVGDTLKMAKNGNYWGAMKTAAGSSKMAQLAEVGPLSATTQTVSAFNPATMMMAVALYSIEKDIAQIAEVQKKILNFLEIENESQIEADVETLMNIVTNYKFNWDNELSVSSSHQIVMDITNRARKNMIAYQKKITDNISSKQFVVAQNKVKNELISLEKNFKYYRLSLYIYSLAAFMEIMLSTNYKEEYIVKIKGDINKASESYRNQFEKASLYLEKLSNIGLEANLVKGLGTAGKAVGKLIGNIPLVKDGSLDELLQDKGEHLKQNAVNMEQHAVKTFASLGNPGTRIFVDKMNDMIKIYNHTSQICFDNENIYLLTE